MKSERADSTVWRPWLERARAGERGAFDALVVHFQDLAFATALGWLRDPARAEDACQEAFVETYRELGALREPAAFPGFLRAVVRKHCDRITRRRGPRPEPAAAAVVARPDELHAERERGARLREAVNALPDGQRLVVALHYLAGLSQPECAAWLELPVTTVKKRLHDARGRLRTELESDLRRVMQTYRPSQDSRFGEVIDFFLALRTGDAAAARRALDARPGLLDAPEAWSRELADEHALPPATGATPLVRAAERGHRDVVELLLDRGAPVDAPCPCAGGETPLWAAIANGSLDAAALLLARGADPDAASFAGHAPLHVAAIRGCADGAALLLAHGADPSRRDAHGRTAADWARAKGRTALAASLGTGPATAPEVPGEPADPAVVEVAEHGADPEGSGPAWETGIQALDVLLRPRRGDRLYCRYGPGQGAVVLLAELSLRLSAEQGTPAVVWVGWERHAVDRAEVIHAFDELGLHDRVVLVWSGADEALAARRAAVARGVEAARGLRAGGARHTAVAVLAAPQWRADVEAALPRFGADGDGSIGAWVFERAPGPAPTRVPEGYQGLVALDPALLPLGVLPAVDARHTGRREPASPLAARLRDEIGWLREHFPDLRCPPDAGVDAATRERAHRARAAQLALAQPFRGAEMFTGRLARDVRLADIERRLAALLEGDDAPAAAPRAAGH